MFLPDHETDVDLICYQPIAQTVVELLKSHPQKPMTLGVHGSWGAGKSSVLKMIQAGLAQDDTVACLWFNGWTFQGFDDAKTVLIESIIEELKRTKTFSSKAREKAEGLIKRVNWLKLAKSGLKYAPGLIFTMSTGIPSPDILAQWFFQYAQKSKMDLDNLTPEQVQQIMDKAPGFLKEAEKTQVPEQIHLIREEFQELLEEAKIKQLVVLIDDLDRCLPETAISTLEAIRLFLFVPGTAFVIGADEAMIEYSVGRHFPDLPRSSGPTSYTRNYLEKLIQIPFRLPALGVEETRIYVLLLMVQALVGEDHAGFRILLGKGFEALKKPWIKSDLTQEDVQAVDPNRREALNGIRLLSNQIGPILAEGTKGNPRQIKRFLNTMVLRHAVARARGFGEEINQSTLAKLMLSERFKPDFYDYMVSQVLSSADGKASLLTFLEEIPAPEQVTRSENGQGTDVETVEAPVSGPSEDKQKWLEQEWIQEWSKIDPKLGSLDLRPYIFVSQDKRIRFDALHHNEELIQLVGILRTSGSIGIRQAVSKVQTLSPIDAQSAFQMLREHVDRAGNYQSKPPGIDGMVTLAQHHVSLRPFLIEFLQSFTIAGLGPWVVSGWGAALSEEPFKTQLNSIFQGWHSEAPDGPLKVALGVALSSTSGRG
ncbi:MAG: P-loop NTPase fold protein [Vampirovibrionales bacterium]|nr:P-loop NTPase fold protein [Vampirovibrionales bacterium]